MQPRCESTHLLKYLDLPFEFVDIRVERFMSNLHACHSRIQGQRVAAVNLEIAC